jgi:4a-hydroxytetrahydrobiopterin dehydratase
MSNKLSSVQIDAALSNLPGWIVVGDAIRREFRFRNYHETMAFVNAVAYVAHRMDHHPDLTVGYSSCRVDYATHSAGGVTELDVEAAKRVSRLVEE